jgi:hypothetical protein
MVDHFLLLPITYVTISSDADAANLQHDLDAEWESKWLMKFHPEKCNVLTISKKRSPSKYIIQRLKWRPLADRRKDARLVMLYKIDRELVAINKENRLIPTGRKTRKSHNRSFQIPSSRIDTRKMSFFPRTVRDWNLLAPDIVELDTPEAFKARIVSL